MRKNDGEGEAVVSFLRKENHGGGKAQLGTDLVSNPAFGRL